MSSGRFVLRATVGGLMLGHGLQKLTGKFGGHGLAGTEQMMGSIGLHPAKHQAKAAALSETIGGGLTAIGLLSPLGPAMITGTMAVAIQKVHGKNGPWITNGGYEYNLTLIAAAFAIAAEGPGHISLDALRRKHRSGIGWALASLAVGLGGAAATLALAEKMAPDEGAAMMETDHTAVTEAPAGGPVNATKPVSSDAELDTGAPVSSFPITSPTLGGSADPIGGEPVRLEDPVFLVDPMASDEALAQPATDVPYSADNL